MNCSHALKKLNISLSPDFINKYQANILSLVLSIVAIAFTHTQYQDVKWQKNP